MKLDPRAAFYLDHREQIETWAALSTLAAAEADRFFETLEARLTAEARELDGTPAVYAQLDTAERLLLLHRPTWIDPDKGWLRVGVGLAWTQDGGFGGGYSGAWVDLPKTGGLDLSLAVRQAIAFKHEGPPLEAESHWVAWRWEVPPPRYWEQLDVFANALIHSVCEHWRSYANLIDGCLV